MAVRSLFLIGFLLVLQSGFTSSFAQSGYEDVLYLKNGEVRRGMIIEEVLNVSLSIQTVDGNIFVYTIDEIDRIAKEPTKVLKAEEPSKVFAAIVDTAPRPPADIKFESWYTYWGIGYSNVVYTKQLDEYMRCRGCDDFSIGMDLFGLYWPLQDQKTILGVVWNGAGDRYAWGDSFTQMISGQWSVSAMHFPNPGIGRGLFLRTDMGYGTFTLHGRENDRDFELLQDEKKAGLSLLVGVGYGFSLGVEGGTRILFNANYAFRPGAKGFSTNDFNSAEGAVEVIGLTAGLLF